VLTNTPTLNSDGTSSATITVQVKDAGNNALPNQAVRVSTTDTGVIISGTGAITDASGVLTRTLSLTNNKANRVIPIVVTSGALVRTLDIPVVGTQLSFNGPSAVSLGSSPVFTLNLRDSGGNPLPNRPVTVTSSNSNVLSPAVVVTNATGQATVTVTSARSGNDTLSATADGANASVSFSVASNSLVFTTPPTLAEVLVNTSQTVTVRYTVNGVAQVGATLNYTATRGTNPGTTTTNGNGEASFTVQSASAGASTLSVTAADGTTASQRIEFVSRIAAALNLQASPSVVGVNLSGSTANSSQLIASVRDASNNPVKGVRVNFTAINDPSNGSIDPPFATTDSSGVATAAFIAGPNSTGNNAVLLRAQVNGTSIQGDTRLTVSQQSLFVRIGTGRDLVVPDNTKYRMPWTAVVTDAAGNPVGNARVNAQLTFTVYRKGQWNLVSSTPGGAPTGWAQTITATCASEDVNRNNQLDPGEDTNGNTTMEPGNVGTILVTAASGTTDAGGFADFQVDYPKSFAQWAYASIRVTITAVGGTEGSTSTAFWLPILAADVQDVSIAPPGRLSPFGQASICSDPN
jgi:hypothetical protein